MKDYHIHITTCVVLVIVNAIVLVLLFLNGYRNPLLLVPLIPIILAMYVFIKKDEIFKS